MDYGMIHDGRRWMMDDAMEKHARWLRDGWWMMDDGRWMDNKGCWLVDDGWTIGGSGLWMTK